MDIPPFFLCPISLEIMRDPVTLTTGITYDRHSIESWTYTHGHHTCPVTKAPLHHLDGTPNHTLRRLIQAWCALHAVDRIPTPRTPIQSDEIDTLVRDARGSDGELAALRRLKEIISESERNRRCVGEESAHAVDLLASLLKKHSSAEHQSMALDILCALKLSDGALAKLADAHVDILDTLTAVLRQPSSSNIKNRVQAITLAKSLVSVIPPPRLTIVGAEFIAEVVKMVQENMSTKAALAVLCQVLPWGRNRVKATEAGIVALAVEILLDGSDKRTCELALGVLDHVCGCAEGRSALVAHPAGLAVVSKKIMRVSSTASQLGVRVLHSVAKHAAAWTVREMAKVGVVAKLCMVVQTADACGGRAREKAVEVLKMHSRVWSTSPCLSPAIRATCFSFS